MRAFLLALVSAAVAGQRASVQVPVFTSYENRYDGPTPGSWFSLTTDWSEGRFPEFPDTAKVDSAVELDMTWDEGAGATTSMQEILIVGDDLSITGADLLVGPRYCDATQTLVANFTSTDDTLCRDNVVCAAHEHETSPRLADTDRTCAQNTCTCAGGTAHSGTACLASSADGAQNSCASCDAGYTLSPGDMGFESGVATWAQEASGHAHKRWEEVRFAQKYKQPVVIAGVPSRGDGVRVIVSIKDVTADGFKMHLHEGPCDGSGSGGADYHGQESVAWLVAEAGTHRIAGQTIVAGLRTGGVSADAAAPTEIAFPGAFSATRPAPAVLAQIQDASYQRYFVNLRQKDADTDSVAVYAQGVGDYQPRGDETVGYLAVQRGESDIGAPLKFTAGVTPAHHGNSDVEVHLGKDFTGGSYAFFGAMHTANGADPAALRYSTLAGTSAMVRIDESTCGTAAAGRAEALSWFAIETGVLTETAAYDSVVWPQCVACGADNLYSQAGNAGDCATCPAGSYTTGGTDHTDHTGCTVCDAGYRCVGDSTPVGCGRGRFAPQGSAACEQCAKGQYNGVENQGQCKQCAHGRFQDTSYDREGGPCLGLQHCAGAESCDLCATGSSPNVNDGSAADTLYKRGHYEQGVSQGVHAVYERAKRSITDLPAPVLHPAALEVGLETWDQGDHSDWHDVAFERTFGNPVVIAGIPSLGDADSVVVSVKDVTSTGFKMHLHKTQCDGDDAHGVESVAWLVAEAGRHTIGGMTIFAGTQAAVPQASWTTISFDGFEAGDEPAVLSQIQDASEDNYFVNLRHRNVGYGTFEVYTQGFAALGMDQVARGDETVGFLILESGLEYTDPYGKVLSAGVTAQVHTHAPTSISLGPSFAAPLSYGLFGSIHTDVSPDPSSLRYSALTNGAATLVIDESTCGGANADAPAERISWFAVEQGELTVDAGYYVGQYITETQLCEADPQGSCIDLTAAEQARFAGVTGTIDYVGNDEIEIARVESQSKCVAHNAPSTQEQCNPERWCEATAEWKGHTVPDEEYFKVAGDVQPTLATPLHEWNALGNNIDEWCNVQCASGPNRWNYTFCPTADGTARSNFQPWNVAGGPQQGQMCQCHEVRQETSAHDQHDGDKECNFAQQCSHVYCTIDHHYCPAHQAYQAWRKHLNKVPATGSGVDLCENAALQGKSKHSIRVHHHGNETTCASGHHCYARGNECYCVQKHADRPDADRCWLDVNTVKSQKACKRLCKREPLSELGQKACTMSASYVDNTDPIISLCGGTVEVVTDPKWSLCQSTAKDDIDGDLTSRISYTLVRRDTSGTSTEENRPSYLAEGVPFATGQNAFLCGGADDIHTCLHGHMHHWFSQVSYGPRRRNPCPRTNGLHWNEGMVPDEVAQTLTCGQCEVYNWTPDDLTTHLTPKAGACESEACSCGRQNGCAAQSCAAYPGAVDRSQSIPTVYDFEHVLRNNEEYVVYLEVCDDSGNCAQAEKAIKVEYAA